MSTVVTDSPILQALCSTISSKIVRIRIGGGDPRLEIPFSSEHWWSVEASKIDMCPRHAASKKIRDKNKKTGF